MSQALIVAWWNCSGPKLPRMIAESRARGLSAAFEAGDDAGAELGEEVAHGGEDQVVLGPEVVVGERRGHPGAAGDLGDGDVERAAVGDLLERGADQGAAPRLGHAGPRCHRIPRAPARTWPNCWPNLLIDGSINMGFACKGQRFAMRSAKDDDGHGRKQAGRNGWRLADETTAGWRTARRPSRHLRRWPPSPKAAGRCASRTSAGPTSPRRRRWRRRSSKRWATRPRSTCWRCRSPTRASPAATSTSSSATGCRRWRPTSPRTARRARSRRCGPTSRGRSTRSRCRRASRTRG